MWSGGISNPLSVIEQAIVGADKDHLRWSRFTQTAPEAMFATVEDEVFP